jgi:16S rRNA (guanine527-N7)-methyltransferase
VQIDEIAVLLRPFAELSHEQLTATLTYINLLQKWNSRVTLTAIRGPREMVTRHFGESFFAAQMLVAHDYTGTAIDLGSGAGFPGVPIAMFAPNAQVTLIESNSKKAAFLNEIIRALDLKNARVFSHRAEEYSHRSSLVVMRAVERFTASVLSASGLVEPGGRLAMMIGQAQEEQSRILLPGWQWQEPIMVPESGSRVLLVGTR